MDSAVSMMDWQLTLAVCCINHFYKLHIIGQLHNLGIYTFLLISLITLNDIIGRLVQDAKQMPEISAGGGRLISRLVSQSKTRPLPAMLAQFSCGQAKARQQATRHTYFDTFVFATYNSTAHFAHVQLVLRTMSKETFRNLHQTDCAAELS